MTRQQISDAYTYDVQQPYPIGVITGEMAFLRWACPDYPLSFNRLLNLILKSQSVCEGLLWRHFRDDVLRYIQFETNDEQKWSFLSVFQFWTSNSNLATVSAQEPKGSWQADICQICSNNW